jgi:membrane protein YdbS with pleckstrin-like domain
MFDSLRAWLLKILRVPPEPHAPFGAPDSTRVFRASRKFYQLRLIGWGCGQLFALAGLIAGVMFFLYVERQAIELRNRPKLVEPVQVEQKVTSLDSKTGKPVKARHRNVKLEDKLAGLLAKIPAEWFFLIWFVHLFAVLLYLAQAVLTYVTLRLDYEMRWYVVTDRSLRIRTGLWAVQEMTMSFANLQQVVTSQGPLQRLLGIADVRVQSAGGGGAAAQGKHAGGLSLHAGYFHGVDNAAEVRDLILARLRQFRESGLGDPDEHRPPAPAPEAVLAARELLAEARALRQALRP